MQIKIVYRGTDSENKLNGNEIQNTSSVRSMLYTGPYLLYS